MIGNITELKMRKYIAKAVPVCAALLLLILGFDHLQYTKAISWATNDESIINTSIKSGCTIEATSILDEYILYEFGKRIALLNTSPSEVVYYSQINFVCVRGLKVRKIDYRAHVRKKYYEKLGL